MTTNQTERVSDEELDQMIWKLERDGMTPKQLSLMRELREVRRNSPVTPDGWVMVPVEPTYQMCQAMALSWESPRFPDRYKAMIEAAPDFRENVNSSTNNCRKMTDTSTNCPKCGGRGTYHCPQMLGTVECECTLPAAPKEVG